MGQKLIEVDTELPLNLIRHQFPMRPCFHISTNKTQGQTLDFVCVYFTEDVMTDSQLLWVEFVIQIL